MIQYDHLIYLLFMILIIIYCSKINIEKFSSCSSTLSSTVRSPAKPRSPYTNCADNESITGIIGDDWKIDYSKEDIEKLSGCIRVDNNILKNHFDSQIDPNNHKCIISNKGIHLDDPNFTKKKSLLKRMTRNACNLACFSANDTNKACFFGTKADGNLADGELLKNGTIRFKFCKEPIT